jgi:hypothetical protein
VLLGLLFGGEFRLQWIGEVTYQDPSTKTYLGSPSLVRTPSGHILATHDYFGPGSPRNHEGEECLTTVYRSEDDGKTWNQITHIVGAFWSSLFVHKDMVYLLGTSAHNGHIVIRRSSDEGNTWTHPSDSKSGLLFRGGPGQIGPNYHCAPTPVVNIRGRLYRAFENIDPPVFASGFRSFVISCDAGADLLDSGNWRKSNELVYDQDADPEDWGGSAGAGWLEGNIVETPSGEIWNILRTRTTPVVDRATIIRVDEGGLRVSCSPFDYIEFPGGKTKFTIRHDSTTGRYWTLSNPCVNPVYHFQRNVLALFYSNDLRRWHYVKTLMDDDNGLSEPDAAQKIGYQYVDWQFDGDDIIYLVRTAYGGAHNFHDSNRITFGRVNDFRDLPS